MTPHTTFANGVNCFTGEQVDPALRPLNQHLTIKTKPRSLGLLQVLDVRRMKFEGATYKSIARKYNVSRWTVCDVILGQGAYKSVP